MTGLAMPSSQEAVHFGAGNIGRGLVGQVYQHAGYHTVFSDVSPAVVRDLRKRGQYTIRELGDDDNPDVIDNFEIMHGVDDRQQVLERLSGASIISTSVGVSHLEDTARTIAEGLADALRGGRKYLVIAYENMVNASDYLHACIEKLLPNDVRPRLAEQCLFANTEVNRIVPDQQGAPVWETWVEPFSELILEQPSGMDTVPFTDGVEWVSDLGPYVERKLFTVNTCHACAAYWGQPAGHTYVAEALDDETIRSMTLATLTESSVMLTDRHPFTTDQQRDYVATTIRRLSNPRLHDTVERVGRSPLRKLSRHDRFIAPTAYLAQTGQPHGHLLNAIGAALDYRNPTDPEAVELERLLAESDPWQIVETTMGLTESDALYREAVDVVSAHTTNHTKDHTT